MKVNGKKRICDALRTLAADRPVEKVAISELIAVAEVNRSTFYYHFDGTQEVLEYMMAEFCRNYLKALAMPPGQTSRTITPESQVLLEQDVCGYVADNEEDIYFFLSDHNYRRFRQRFQAYFYEYCALHRVVQHCPDGRIVPIKRGITYDYYVHILCAQFFGILEYWAERNFSEGPEEFIEIFNTMHTGAISLQG